MADNHPVVSLYASVHDVGIFGAGYAGYAAAVRLAGEGKRVFLADLTGGLLWESGRAFFPEPGPRSQGFDYFKDVAARISGIAGEWIDGSTAEFTANELLRDSHIPLLYYVTPVAVERAGDAISAVVVATKSGLRRLVARQWVDATEAGTLARVAGLARGPRKPERLIARLMFQKRQWRSADRAIRSRACPGCRLSWQGSGWSTERVLQLDMPGGEGRFLRFFVPALEALRAEAGAELDESYVSHSSFEPFPVYASGPAPQSPASNLVLAVPGYAPDSIRNLGERYRLGHEAAGLLGGLPSSRKTAIPGRPPRLAMPSRKGLTARTAVSGLGTGGAVAALAAARAGARVVAFDPFPFAGGIGTGGGIPEYYWGSEGGLQAEVDDRVRRLMPLFGGRDCWPRGFHPDAKRVVLDEMLHEAGVKPLYGALLASVIKQGSRVKTALLASPGGLLRLDADTWIDATGDGDFCALAGAKTRLGRTGDHLTQPYTQSCGHFLMQKGRLVAHIVNPDSGIVDPVDSEDATRGRVEGLHSLFIEQRIFNAFDRLTHATPLLSVRQGRTVETDYMLTLDDLVERRRFADAVGYTGMHYDNHAADYEFESDDAFFFVNCAGLWSLRTACEMPYRMLLPKGLSNVWIACRATGLSEEAVHSCRVQRDMQRIGEVSGLAAALAGRRGDSRSVSYAALKRRLAASGALSLKESAGADFGRSVAPAEFASAPDAHAGLQLWLQYRKGPRAAGPEIKAALRAKDPHESWKAAQLLGAWGDRTAEPRLLAAMAGRETGPEDAGARLDPVRGCRTILPRWWRAVILLRRCATPRSLPELFRLGEQKDLPFHLKTALALSLAALPARMRVSAADRKRVGHMLEWMEKQTTDLTGSAWPLAYAACRARVSWGLAVPETYQVFKTDSRATVRRAFQEMAI